MPPAIAAAIATPPSVAGKPGFGELVAAFLRIGLLSFGGAAGQIAMMHRIVVDEKRWLDETRYLHALNYCMLLPGPEAQQLATYIGWLTHGVRGGLAAGILFVLPGALLMLGLSLLYVLGAGVSLIEGAFFGVSAAVLAIVAQAVLKIAGRGLKSPLLKAMAVVAFLAILLLDLPFPVIVIGAGLAGAALAVLAPSALALSAAAAEPPAPHAPGRARGALIAAAWCLAAWWAPIALAALTLGAGHVLVDIGLFFSKLAVLTFGGAYAVLAWVTQEAVQLGWVTPAEMVSGLGLAETTPGPTILVNQWVAFLGAMRGADGSLWLAALGAAMATWATFAPSFLFIFAGAPFVEDLRRDRRLSGALTGVTAAVVGVIAFVALWFALNTLFGESGYLRFGLLRLPTVELSTLDPVALALTALGFLMAFRLKLGVAASVGVLAALGAAIRLGGF
jgi:chromate transporter